MRKHLIPQWAIASVSLFLTLASCSTPNSKQGSNDIEESPRSAPGTETITILGTNDIHGTLAPLDLKTREPEGTAPVDYQAGGAAYLASYVKKLRSELGDRLMWLDGGDEFQGSIESNLNRGAAMVQFFNTAGLNAAAVGNHEFDFGGEPSDSSDKLSALKNRMSEAHYPYLAANIYDKSTDRLASFPNTLPSRIFQAGKIKVGVIGLSTTMTPTTTRAENVVGLKFGDLKQATLREAKALRESGAQVVLITAHAGLFCDLLHSPPGHVLRAPTDPQGDCDKNQEIVQLLKSLPSGTVDAVVSGHTHSVVHHYVAGIPVIQGGASGRYFNLIHLSYDLTQKKLLTDRTRIEGPIPICPLVFKNQGDCNGDRPAPSIGRGPLVKPVFRKEEINADRDVQARLEPVFAIANQAKSEVYGQAARPIDPQRYQESPLGNLVADALRDAAKTDFALVNSGGIRVGLEPGSLTYGNIFHALPFDNDLVVLTVTGRQLKLMLRIGESGSRGFHPFSGLKARVITNSADAPADDLNQDGRIEPWEINRLIELKTTQGEAIQDDKEYTVATLDFLVTGGDDYAWIMKQIPAPNKRTMGILERDVVAAYIRKLTSQQGAINSVEHPMVDPANPRLIFEKPKVAKTKKKHSRHRKKKKAA